MRKKFVVKASSKSKMRNRISASTSSVKRSRVDASVKSAKRRKVFASDSFDIVIKNRSQIVEELAEMLKQFDKDLNNYQTDVYLYYDEDKQTAELDTFTNVGGNSWLDDDHYTIYKDKEHYEDPTMDGYDEALVADMLGMTEDELRQEVADYLGYTGIDGEYGPEDVDWREILDYIENKSDYYQVFVDAYEDSLDDYDREYLNLAEDIISTFESDYKEQQREIAEREREEKAWKDAYESDIDYI